MLKDEPLLLPNKIGTDGTNRFPSVIKTSVDSGLLHPDPVHHATKHIQQGIEIYYLQLKKSMPKIGGFQSFNTALRTIASYEAMLALRRTSVFRVGNANDQNDLLAHPWDCKSLTKHEITPV
jgi:transposase, IS6 family